MNHRNLCLSLAFLALVSALPLSAAFAETDRERDERTGNDVDRSVAAHKSASDTQTELPPVKEENFGGHWLWAEGDERFTLTLTQNGEKLTGFHSVQRYSDGRTDGVSGGTTPSITGLVHDSSMVARWRSGAPGSEAYGHARLTLRGRYLYWELMDSSGEHYLPDHAVLIRQQR
jgi:hypothetical protein